MKKGVSFYSFLVFVFLFFPFSSYSQTITSDTTLANNYLSIGEKYFDSGSYDSAGIYFEKAKNLYVKHLGVNSLKTGNVLDLIAQVYEKENQYYNALDNYSHSLNILREILGDKHSDVARTNYKLGILYIQIAKYEDALKHLQKSLEIRKELFGENSPDVAIIYFSFGTLYKKKGEYHKALEGYQKSMEIYSNIFGEKHPFFAISSGSVGSIYSDIGEYDKALEFLNKSLIIMKETYGENDKNLGTLYLNIGILYKEKGDDDKALEQFQKSLKIYLKILGEKNPLVGTCYFNFSTIYFNKGEFDKALEYLQKNLQIKLETLGEKHPEVARTLCFIGTVYNSKGDYNKAEELFINASRIQSEILDEKHPQLLETYNNLGLNYHKKGEYNKALEYSQKVLNIRLETLGEIHPDVAISYNNIAASYFKKGESKIALENYQKALELYLSIFGKKHTGVVTVYTNISSEYIKKGEYKSALFYIQKALVANVRDFNDSLNIFANPTLKSYINGNSLLFDLKLKAECHYNCYLNDLAKSNSNSITSENRIDKQIPDSTIRRLHASKTSYQLCDTLINQIRRTVASETDKMSVGATANQIYAGAINVCYKLAENTTTDEKTDHLNQAFYFSEQNKSVVLLQALAGSESLSYSGIPDTIIQKEHSLKIDISYYNKKITEGADSSNLFLFQNKLFALNREYEELISRLEKNYPKYYNLKYTNKQPTVKDIQNLLDRNTALRSYILGDSTITIFTLTRNQMDLQQVPKIKNLNDSITWFRYGLTKSSLRMKESYLRLGYTLYQQLFPQSYLIDKQIEKLVIIPDGELAIIPFESLLTANYDGDINKYTDYPYLIKKYKISYSYSANLYYLTFFREVAPSIEIKKLNDWLAFAPVFNQGTEQKMMIASRELQHELNWLQTDSMMISRSIFDRGNISPLPATEIEAEAILKLYDNNNLKAKVLLHNSANEKSIKSGELEHYKVLHFATHGFVNSEKPELSGLLLEQDTTGGEDGILYSGEIYNLKLNTDLVVLSACETGLGKIQKGEGIIGLTRALLYAGSKNIIVSLWQVADESTSKLMIDFYKNAIDSKGKQGYSEALRNAKLIMINEGKFAHPLYWSPFILIGK